MTFRERLAVFFGYDAAEAKGKRKAPVAQARSEDGELDQTNRDKTVTSMRDLNRNFSLAGWMVRRHLDYVSTFSFQPTTGDEALDVQVQSLIDEWSQKENCDAAGRMSLANMVRVAEARRTIDHDCLLVKLTDGRLQGIEGDRIRTPLGGLAGVEAAKFTHGVLLGDGGAALAYAVSKRQGLTGFVHERLVPAANAFHHAKFDRFDQVRGYSELAAAVNTMRDCYEGFDFALAKMKVAQLFGLVTFRQAPEALGDVTENDETTPTDYSVDFGRGPFQLDLDPGDDAKFLESQTPSTEFQTFSATMISVALKALDIPYSFYAENFTNYSGARQALLQYQQAADIRRADVQAMLNHLTRWRLGLYIQDGRLPASVLDKLRWLWVPRGMPWIDPKKEIEAEILAIEWGLDNQEDICQRHGKDAYANVDKRKRFEEYAAGKKVVIATQTKPAAPAAEQKESEDNERIAA